MVKTAKKDPLQFPKQQIVNLMCPKSTVAEVDALLSSIRLQAQQGQTARTSAIKEEAFKCKGCGGDRAVLYTTHTTCKACGLVKNLVHSGQEWRNIKERGDLNTNGIAVNYIMSPEYNSKTYISNTDAQGKKVSAKLKRTADLHNKTPLLTRDKHIIKAREAFADCCDRVYYGANTRESMELFVQFLTSVKALHRKDEVMAACMFHTLKAPTGPVWKKKWRKKTPFNTSKQRRLKFMTFNKRPNPKYK